MSSICILGRQPAIGLAELESLFGTDTIKPACAGAAIVNLPYQEIPFQRLGGTIKLAKLMTSLPTTTWKDIETHLAKHVPQYIQQVPEGKLHIGLSVYGSSISARQLQASSLTLKKLIKDQGRSVRVVPNQEAALSSAQVIHNKLTGERGWELVIVKDGSQTHLGQTVAVQDINAYAARDQARPKRDTRVGMLPPKLAQIIINLAVGKIEKNEERRMANGEETKNSSFPVLHSPFLVLDPFCGTGVILQEAALMGYSVYGIDVEARMAEFSQTNLKWIIHKYAITSGCMIEIGDATRFAWREFALIASETYLGRPFSAEPKPEILQQVLRDVDTIHKKFLQNVARQTKPGFRMCLAVPAWKTSNGFKHLPTLDHLTELGYTRVSFVHVRNEDLIYHRPNQIVARELVVLQRT